MSRLPSASLRAQRAVGRACATNPVALVVPCHRVVREDGGLGGYAWGIERKRALLEREAAAGRRGRGARVNHVLGKKT